MRTTLLIVMLFVLGTAASAKAATRTVCFELKIRDARFDCPTSTVTGVRRACVPGSDAYAVGHVFEVWDKDAGDGSADEFIGTWHTGGPGVQCLAFEWENAAYSKGEVHPDIYLRYKNIVAPSGASSTDLVRIRRKDDTPYGDIWWRNGETREPDRYVAINCKPGVSCRIFSAGWLLPTSNGASNYGQALMALDFAQRVVELYSSQLDNTTIWIEYPTDLPNCTTACSTSRTLIGVPTGLADDGDRLTHEMGHSLQQHQFNQDSLRNDCSLNGSGWSVTSTEFESCATTEGWASYVAVVAWWNPQNTGSTPQYSGNTVETATPTNKTSCAKNKGIPLQVARAFWDLDDANNEVAVSPATTADGSDLTRPSISAGWAKFPDGTANHQDFETNTDGHAVNGKDYDSNFDVDNVTFFDHNCIGSQTSG